MAEDDEAEQKDCIYGTPSSSSHLMEDESDEEYVKTLAVSPIPTPEERKRR